MESILTCHKNRYKMKPSMERVPHFRYQPHFLKKTRKNGTGFIKISMYVQKSSRRKHTMKKNLASLALVSAMALSLVACGGNSGSSSGGAAPASGSPVIRKPLRTGGLRSWMRGTASIRRSRFTGRLSTGLTPMLTIIRLQLPSPPTTCRISCS